MLMDVWMFGNVALVEAALTWKIQAADRTCNRGTLATPEYRGQLELSASDALLFNDFQHRTAASVPASSGMLTTRQRTLAVRVAATLTDAGLTTSALVTPSW